MADILEFTDLFQEYRGALVPGKLKIQQTGLAYKNLKTGKVDQYRASDLKGAYWITRAKGKCLRIELENCFIHKFDGFKESDFERLGEYLNKHFQIKLEKQDRCVKGWNWGVPHFNGNTFEFKLDGLTSFEIPLANVSHSRLSKNEVTVEFHQNDEAPVNVVEVTFWNPTVVMAEEFHNNVVSRADVIQATGDAITIFNEVQCLTPRGRYDIKIYPSFFQLHGKTFDYKIPYKNVVRLFLLPHRDTKQFYFLVSLDPPIRQGQTRYPYLVFLFSKEDETSLELSLSQEDIDKKYDGKIKKEMSGPEYEVISQIIKVLVNKKITIPGSFMGHTKTHSLSCSYKAATGYLYPLDRGFAYVYKPPIYVRFDEISSVNFGRSAGSTRSFDFDVDTNGGVVYNFVGIEKEEYGHLSDFVKQKNLRVKNTDKSDSRKVPSYRDDMEESGDEDRVHNAYMERMKIEGKEREVDDDDDDESDESFKPDASGSEPDDEYDSNHESSSESDTQEKPMKKRKIDDEKMEVGDEEKMEDGESEKEDKNEKKKEKEKKKESKKPSEKKNSKKEKDANKPKRPQSAYFLWLGENRSKLKIEFPGIVVTELTKKAGERWKEVKDKSKWEKMAVIEKASYESAMAAYKKGEKGSPSAKDGKKSKKTEPQSSNVKSKEFVSEDSNNEGSHSDMSE